MPVRTTHNRREPKAAAPHLLVARVGQVDARLAELLARMLRLDEVAQLTGLAPSEVIAAHTGSLWRVAFGGFTPGFAYLVGGDERLQVPRRSEPRTRVPAGSVALAGEFGGVYPRETPGGWQLIGRTDATLWDLEREQPALLIPGMHVQFRAIG